MSATSENLSDLCDVRSEEVGGLGTGNRRQNRIQKTGEYMRQETGDRRQKTGDWTQKTEDRRQET